MKTSDRYLKFVEWSEEDQCYVGTCPGFFHGGVHGSEERKVYAELCEVVEEHIEFSLREGLPLPPPTNREYSGKFMLRVNPDLHKVIAIQAMKAGQSLNSYCQSVLKAAAFPMS
jgi:predicted HicB family RNase H-like nuclease